MTEVLLHSDSVCTICNKSCRCLEPRKTRNEIFFFFFHFPRSRCSRFLMHNSPSFPPSPSLVLLCRSGTHIMFVCCSVYPLLLRFALFNTTVFIPGWGLKYVALFYPMTEVLLHSDSVCTICNKSCRCIEHRKTRNEIFLQKAECHPPSRPFTTHAVLMTCSEAQSTWGI